MGPPEVYMGIEVDANSGIEVDSSQSVDQSAWAAVEARTQERKSWRNVEVA